MKLRILKLFFFILITLLFESCKQIPYADDVEFTSSLQANSPEYDVYLNNKLCKNGEGEIGLCIFKIQDFQDLDIMIKKKPYAYKVSISCGNNVNIEHSFDVPKDQQFDFSIDSKRFNRVNVFNCTIDIFPHDREKDIGSFAAFRAFVVDSKYKPLEKPFVISHYTVFGQFAKHIIADGEYFNKTTALDMKSECCGQREKFDKIRVESHNMRISYYGY